MNCLDTALQGNVVLFLLITTSITYLPTRWLHPPPPFLLHCLSSSSQGNTAPEKRRAGGALTFDNNFGRYSVCIAVNKVKEVVDIKDEAAAAVRPRRARRRGPCRGLRRRRPDRDPLVCAELLPQWRAVGGLRRHRLRLPVPAGSAVVCCRRRLCVDWMPVGVVPGSDRWRIER